MSITFVVVVNFVELLEGVMLRKKQPKHFCIILLVMSLIFSGLEVKAQKQSQTKTKSEGKKTQNSQNKCPPNPPTISHGVLNTKALNLVKPEYPSIAKHGNIYGRVIVSVSVDENGYVESAIVSSGHPMLRAASLKAALQSTFKPVTLSGCPAKVSGIIVYNFLSQNWNWFEIGYALGNNYCSGYYSFGNVKDALPFGYEEKNQLLKQAEESYERRSTLTELVISSIKSKLLNDAKNTWLFSMGLLMADVSQAGFDMNQKLQNLNTLIQLAPKDISETLLSDLRKLAMFVKRKPFPTEEFWQEFREIEKRFPGTGR